MDLSKVTLDIFTKLEQKWLSPRKTRVLSIDGGGTTAIVAGAYIVHLEDQIRLQTGDPHAQISDFFDIVAGTGIGGILAALLLADDGSGRPMFTARDAVSFISEKNSELFEIRRAGVFRRNGTRYSAGSMERALEAAFRRRGKVLTMKDTCKPLLVPCYDLRSSAPFVFSRAGASESPSFDFELWKVCRATSATPGLFKPVDVVSVDGKTSCLAVDGGLVMNNPSAAAVTHVLHNKRDFPSVNGVDDLLVLSLGNGSSSSSSSPGKKQLRRNGDCSTSCVVDIVLDGVSDTVDQMLGNAFCWNRTDYVRIQMSGLTRGGEGSVGPRKTAEELLKERGVETAPFGGKRLLSETNGERIESFVQRLVASGKSTSLPPSPCKESAVNPLADGR
ncbi:putative inactive patatin-like protein 9 [Raphanus sativus]|uniref:Patatin n=1 Tax=Raphanus sativus TaxID=3726 RepID=A0A9W3BTT2_RAPSA|nr:probable inactive patatin-like protein 9 [Raphanus sativus]KAJ4896464.1 putative inactive patatin-like protein 9 [Raphanus sativus]